MLSLYPLIHVLAEDPDRPGEYDVISTATGLPKSAVEDFRSLVRDRLIAVGVDPAGFSLNVSGEATCCPANLSESATYHAQQLVPYLRRVERAA